MPTPGVTVTVRDTPPPRSAPTDTGVWFVAGLTEKGPLTPREVTSMDQFASVFGAKQSYSVLHDALETYFNEGGARAYVSRVVGPAATAAFSDLIGTTTATLRVSAKSVGEWGNSLRREVTNGTDATTRILIIRDQNGVELERSPQFATDQEFVTWSESATYVTITQLADTGLPAVVASGALTGGTDDRAAITDTQWDAAQDRFGADLGPGQVSMPGRTTTAAHTSVLNHAAARNRVALLDGLDTATVGTLRAASAAVRGLASAANGGMFAPWIKVPGTSPTTTRDIPPSALAAGVIARSDAANSPNVAAAGDNGAALFANDVKVRFTDAEIFDLELPERNAGTHGPINVIKVVNGQTQVYGNRTLVDPVARRLYLQLSNARLDMDVRNAAQGAAGTFVFDQIDGKGRKIAEYNTAMVGVLKTRQDQGAVFAFNVDTGPQTNTATSLAAGQLKAVLSYSRSPGAEDVQVQIVRVATNAPVG